MIVPFRYSGLLAALGIGFAVWGEIPTRWPGPDRRPRRQGFYMVISERARARERLFETAPE